MSLEVTQYAVEIMPVKKRFYDYETNFGIYVCGLIKSEPVIECKKGKNDYDFPSIVVKGTMPSLGIGHKYECCVTPENHEKYGLGYKIISFDNDMTELEILRVITTSQRQFESILAVYPNPITALKNKEVDYKKVKYLSEKQLKNIMKKLHENEEYFYALSKLYDYGLSYTMIKNITDFYSDARMAVNAVTKNPYDLYLYISGIGWETADKIAQKVGIAKDSMVRITACAIYILRDNESSGNTWMYLSDVCSLVERSLSLELDIDKFLTHFKTVKLVWFDEEKCAMSNTRTCELEVAQHIKRILDKNNINKMNRYSIDTISYMIGKVQQNNDVTYTSEQRSLFFRMFKDNLVLLTAPAGAGKTFCLKGLLDILDMLDVNYVLASPVGKAAKVMEQHTQRKASTIHRLLSSEHVSYERGDNNEIVDSHLSVDLVVIDEVGLCDLYLMRTLLQNISSHTKVLFIGDQFQLESINVGNVLKDLIESNVVPVIHLTQVFRQALYSGILDVATRIRNDKLKYNPKLEINQYGINNDCVIWLKNKDFMVQKIAILYEQLVERFSVDDVMVISPMRGSDTGVTALNIMLQQIYNPPNENKKEIKSGNKIFREGDKVINIKNQYDALWLDDSYGRMENKSGIFNGTIGTIVKITLKDDNIEDSQDLIFVKFEDFIICYEHDMFSTLDLSYCLTGHKMQGSSCKNVIVVMNQSHYVMLKRSWLYTAVTRASERCYILTDSPSLGQAIKNNPIEEKRTFLVDFLKMF